MDSPDIPAWIDGQLQPCDKLDVHRRALKHPAVSVFVLHDNALLIQRRALGKYHTPGLWANTCCTHPLWGEEPATCANRRLVEELGLSGLSLEHRGQVEYRAEVGGGMIEHEVVDLFLAVCTTRPALKPNPVEVMDTRWVDLHALHQELDAAPERFTPWLRVYLREHAHQVFPGL